MATITVTLDSRKHYKVTEDDGVYTLLEFSSECPGMGQREPFDDDTESAQVCKWGPGDEVKVFWIGGTLQLSDFINGAPMEMGTAYCGYDFRYFVRNDDDS